MPQTAIEKWVRELVNNEMQKQINNRHVASRAFVLEATYQMRNEIVKIFKEMNNEVKILLEEIESAKNEKEKPIISNTKKEKTIAGGWTESETESLKKEFNDFLIAIAFGHDRSNASIKGKLFSLLQQSYGRI